MQHSTQSDSLGWPQFVPPDKPCRQSIHIFKRRQKKGSAFLAGGGGRGAGGAPVSPSATARSAAGVLDRPVSARPRFFTVVHAIDSCFRKFFLFFPGGVGGGCLPVSCGRAQNARKIFCFFCGWYVVESCSKLRVIPLAAGP